MWSGLSFGKPILAALVGGQEGHEGASGEDDG